MGLKCRAVTSKGERCSCPVLKGETLCLFHSQSERAKALRKQPKKGPGISRRELFLSLSRDYRELAAKTDEQSRRERLRMAPLLHELINEVQELSKLKKLAKEKGLL